MFRPVEACTGPVKSSTRFFAAACSRLAVVIAFSASSRRDLEASFARVWA